MTVHPVDQTNIVLGRDASFSVTATGTAPLRYQWQKDGVDLTVRGSITGAYTATLAIIDVMESDEGGYRCVVTNSLGMDISSTAMLTVGKWYHRYGLCVMSHYKARDYERSKLNLISQEFMEPL